MRRFRHVLQTPAHFQPVHAGHHDIEEHQVDTVPDGDFQRILSVQGCLDVEVLRLQPNLQKPDIGEDVIDYKDTRCHVDRVPS